MKNVILIGYMGCGKSSVGVKLSYRMKKSLIDTDKEIERLQGMSISDIFAKKGEETFRQMETEYIKGILHNQNFYVISTGGGLPLREENQKILKQLGTVVYLRTKPETIYARLKGDTTRPLLQCENPKEKIRKMIETRKEAYEKCADVIVDTDQLTLAEIVDRIVVNCRKTELVKNR